MGIKDLIGKDDGQGRPLASRLSPVTMEKILSDLREVVKAEKAGSSVPSITGIVRFIKSEYNVKMARSTVGVWLEKAREETNGKDN